MNCIEVSGLSKQYGDFFLRDISFNVPGGSIVGLIGENGAGKSTTLKCILDLIRPDAGEIKIFGQDSRENGQQVRQEIGVVMDECFFHDTLYARDVDLILSSVYKNWDSELYFDYLNKYNLPEKKLIKEFSRGMKAKLSLAAALAHRPKLLILDEATSGLDPIVRDEILDEFLEFIQDESRGILVSSHIITDLEKVADYIIYIHQGALLLNENKDDILSRYGRLACSIKEFDRVDSADVLRMRQSSFGCEALITDRKRFGRKYPDLMVEPVKLEEIMLFFGRGDKS